MRWYASWLVSINVNICLTKSMGFKKKKSKKKHKTSWPASGLPKLIWIPGSSDIFACTHTVIRKYGIKKMLTTIFLHFSISTKICAQTTLRAMLALRTVGYLPSLGVSRAPACYWPRQQIVLCLFAFVEHKSWRATVCSTTTKINK